jgi:hypothetical protein
MELCKYSLGFKHKRTLRKERDTDTWAEWVRNAILYEKYSEARV